MDASTFVYRIPGRTGGQRPGAHAARTTGSGNEFSSHAKLFDVPDPRRLDLRASLRSAQSEWLVRTYRQRAAIPVIAAVDVSPSMAIGAPLRKLDLAAQFVGTMADSAFQVGDAAGMIGFDGAARADLYVPSMHGRGAGRLMREAISHASPVTRTGCGLAAAVQTLAGRDALVFIVSDYHWPLEHLSEALDILERAWVVPLVIWDPSETTPPSQNGFLRLQDAEGGQGRPLWVNAALRRRWTDSVQARRDELNRLFASRNLRPLYFHGSVSTDTLSQYFLELAA